MRRQQAGTQPQGEWGRQLACNVPIAYKNGFSPVIMSQFPKSNALYYVSSSTMLLIKLGVDPHSIRHRGSRLWARHQGLLLRCLLLGSLCLNAGIIAWCVFRGFDRMHP